MTLHVAVTVAERGLAVDLTVAAGETVALLGENGAGKSTVLEVVAGRLLPDHGTVTLAGRRLTETGGRRRAQLAVPPHRRDIALLAQDPLLFPHLTVRDNVAFGPRSAGHSARAAREIAEHWLTEVDAAAWADRMPAEVSGGQAQRIAVARALAADPHLLLLDEPMSALDVAVTPALRQTLRRVLTDRTAVIVTHDVLDALLLADRVVVLADGRVVEDGPSGEVLARPRSAFAARLAGLNLLRGTWTGDGVRLVDGSEVRGLAHDAPAVDGPAVATFRPSAVAIYRDAPAGSPRNTFPAVITELEPRGDLIRVRTDTLSADITPQSVAALDLVPGLPVTLSVKATEVAVYGL